MTRPRAILFDLDDTILPGFARPELAWREVAEETVGPRDGKAVADEIRSVSRALWSDPRTHAEWRMRMADARRKIVTDACAALAARGGPSIAPVLAHEIADLFSQRLDDALTILPDAHHVLETLKRNGFGLALITNGASAPQRAKIERFDLAHRFDHVQIEGEAGFGKPEPQAYTHAMQALGVAPHETWMVGDNLEWEVVAPQKLGVFAVWADLHGRGLPEGSDIRPDMIVTTMSELLPPLLDGKPSGSRS